MTEIKVAKEYGAVTYQYNCPVCGKQVKMATMLEALGFLNLCNCGQGGYFSIEHITNEGLAYASFTEGVK